MKKLAPLTALTAVVIFASTPASAQTGLPLTIGLSGGAAFPTGQLGRDDAIDTGWGFEVSATLDAAPGIGIYAAYDRFTFPFDRDIFGLAEVTGDLVDQGFAGGLVLSVPTGGAGLDPWIRGGGIYNSARFDYDMSDDDPESDSALGFEVGAGLAFPLGRTVAIRPSIRYRAYEPDFASDDDLEISYVVGDVGLTFRF